MSEVDSRTAPSRGRSSTRGGRAGYTRGGPRGAPRSSNGTAKDSTVQFDEPVEDEGELGDMKKKYADQLALIKDIFPEWTDVDLIFALAEADGDVETTIERVSAGKSVSSLTCHMSPGRTRQRHACCPCPTWFRWSTGSVHLSIDQSRGPQCHTAC